MPIICYKNKLKIDNYEEKISIAFNCKYDNNNHLKLKNYIPNYFDSGDFRTKIEEAINKLNSNMLKEYKKRNNDILYLSIVNYFIDEIPSIYSIKFESEDSESIYYTDELKKKN